jgi:hypothetical protein
MSTEEFELYWNPKSKGKDTLINLDHHNSQEQRKGTINSVARMMDMEEKGKGNLTKEDVAECIKINAKKLNIDPQELIQEATEALENLPEE